MAWMPLVDGSTWERTGCTLAGYRPPVSEHEAQAALGLHPGTTLEQYSSGAQVDVAAIFRVDTGEVAYHGPSSIPTRLTCSISTRDEAAVMKFMEH